ncbi:MAG: hypothetical protein WC623_21680 [Pedobacter sp.]
MRKQIVTVKNADLSGIPLNLQQKESHQQNVHHVNHTNGMNHEK